MTVSDYLRFGGDRGASGLRPEETLRYLQGLGFDEGYLQQARAAVAARTRETFTFEALNANYCDFCFTKLMGGEFDRLKDGRERCVRCSRTVVRTPDEFGELFYSVRRNMETAFGINLTTAMVVRMANAKEVARRTGEVFQPTSGVDPRTLGFASRSREGYTLVIENGAPRLASIATMAHELTHIWQYLNWNEREIVARYGAKHRLQVYEGMATWAQIQYLLYIREFAYAERQEAYARQRTDEYGIGFRMFSERYPLDRTGLIDQASPFLGAVPF